MKSIRMFAAIAVLMLCTLGASAQNPGTWSTTQVVLSSVQVGNGANFTLNTHNINQDICITFTVDPSSYNVQGDVAGTYNVRSSQNGDIYVGRYSQVNTAQAWHVYVTFHWTSGVCQ